MIKLLSNAQFTEVGGMRWCTFDTENFVYWLNEVYFIGEKEKAFIVKRNASRWKLSDFKLYF